MHLRTYCNSTRETVHFRLHTHTNCNLRPLWSFNYALAHGEDKRWKVFDSVRPASKLSKILLQSQLKIDSCLFDHVEVSKQQRNTIPSFASRETIQHIHSEKLYNQYDFHPTGLRW